MAECRHYCVADFFFSVQADETVLATMTNYEPFRVTEVSGRQLFSLQVVDNACDVAQSEWTHVFTDTSDDDMPRIEVYRAHTQWILQISMVREAPICTRICATEDFSQAKIEIHTENKRFAMDNACMLLYAFTTATLGALEMHASVTVKDGKGYLFLGHSGTGKSTHSRLWQEAFEDASLLNDDNPVLRYIASENGQPVQVRVYGSPWSGKTPCYINRSVPVGAIVKLSQAPHNQIRPLRLPEAYAYMLSSSSGLKIVPSMMDALYATIAATIQTIQVYGLECLPDVDAARVCHAMVTDSK